MSSLSIGIVGLPNVGKSTLFNAITRAGALAANYPFATIEPNVGRVAVPDRRLDELTRVGKSQKTVPTSLEFVDIAGLGRHRVVVGAWPRRHLRRSRRHRGLQRRGPLRVHHRRPGILAWRVHLLAAPRSPVGYVGARGIEPTHRRQFCQCRSRPCRAMSIATRRS